MIKSPLQKDSHQNLNTIIIVYIAYIRDFFIEFAI